MGKELCTSCFFSSLCTNCKLPHCNGEDYYPVQGGRNRETSKGFKETSVSSIDPINVDRQHQRAPMSIIYGQCASCDITAEYSADEMKKPAIVACKKCGSKSVWRVYTPAELDKMREGEKVD